MTARTFDVDDLRTGGHKGPGVRRTGEKLLTYDLAVLAGDVATVVTAAGGWLCDRVRAGWRVTVLTPGGAVDTTALTILGVDWAPGTSLSELPGGHHPTAVAVDARLLAGCAYTRSALLEILDGARTEVTVWGESPSLEAGRRFHRVHHRLSAAARAFKSHAVQACGGPADLSVEEFHSIALWYAPDGTDLAPAGRPAGT
ncbi:hypothetical protein ACEWX3_18395 [Mycobacterium sp. G7A2]|uniref:hypothetical protein n=1 Tax=Mycobacterium sp. G7A2 TaxID=3317307 RepID=UPI0035A8C5F0